MTHDASNVRRRFERATLGSAVAGGVSERWSKDVGLAFPCNQGTRAAQQPSNGTPSARTFTERGESSLRGSQSSSHYSISSHVCRWTEL